MIQRLTLWLLRRFAYVRELEHAKMLAEQWALPPAGAASVAGKVREREERIARGARRTEHRFSLNDDTVRAAEVKTAREECQWLLAAFHRVFDGRPRGFGTFVEDINDCFGKRIGFRVILVERPARDDGRRWYFDLKPGSVQARDAAAVEALLRRALETWEAA